LNPGIDQIPAELIQAGDETRIYSIWIEEELSQQWN
jgi:hypothetical protein